ncbi:WD40 repeat domain-containing protein [Vermiphilus pyriformis]|nr:MAG: WD40 repeat domain-containing protein [Vermiphilus pyriformis]
MNRTYIYMLLMLSGVFLYSADKDIQQLSDTKTCPHIIVHEGISAVHTDIYTKLLAISRTLQDQVNDFGKPTLLTDNLYYPINRNIESLEYIVNYISAQNTDTYLNTLSLLELVQLYQEADFWAVDEHILDTIRNSIIDQLRNADTLSRLFSSKENLSHFINAGNLVTLDTLTQALHAYTSNLLWHTTQTLTGHNKWISSVAVHTDGTLLSSSGDETIRVWKKDSQGTYYCAQTLKGYSKYTNTVAVYTDGTLFSGFTDNTIRIWKPDAQGTYHCVQALTDYAGWVNTLAVHTNGTLFSGSNYHEIRVWKPDALGIYHCVQTLTGHTDSINTVAVHTDGTLFSGSNDGTVRVWKQDAQGIYHCVQTLTDHTKQVKTIAVHTDDTLFSGSYDNTIRVWKKDTQDTYHCVQTLTGHTDSIKTVAVHTDGTLFSGSYNNTIRVWKKDTQGTYYCVQTLVGHTGWINSVALHTDGTLFSCSLDGTIRIWKTLEEHLSLEQHLLLHWLYTTYQLNGKTQINTLPAHMIDIYHTLPQSIKDHIVTWYNPGYIKYLFSKPYVWVSGGLIAGCTALGAYLYYRYFKK